MKNIYIFAGMPYYDLGGGQRSAQLAKTFTRLGHEVHYFYIYGSSDSKPTRVKPSTKTHMNIRKLTPRYFYKNNQNSIFIFEIPHQLFLPYLKLGKALKAKIVYEHIDNWNTYLGKSFFNLDLLHQFLEQADLISTTSKLLKQQIEGEVHRIDALEGINKILYCPNAVDTDLFNPKLSYLNQPPDLRVGEKTLIFYGSLWGDWINWKIVKSVAKKCNCTINLIGDQYNLSPTVLEMPDNVYFLGLKRQEELPAYLHYSTIAILPFKNNNIGKFVSPLKVFEYMAMNKPILSTALEELKDYPNVHLANDPEAWVRFIHSSLPVVNNAFFIKSHNWYARCKLLLST